MSPLLFSLKWFGRVCFVNKCYWDHIQKIFITRHILIIQMFFAYSIHYVSVFYSYLYNYSIGNGSQQQFVQYYIYTYIQNLHIKHQTCYVQSPGIHVSVIPVGNEKYTKWKSNSSILFYIQHILPLLEC